MSSGILLNRFIYLQTEIMSDSLLFYKTVQVDLATNRRFRPMFKYTFYVIHVY